MASFRHRRDGGLDVVRARHRTSAFVYGNITVLGALVAVDSRAVETGHAAIAVAATAVATFIAHIAADLVSERVRPDHLPGRPREELAEELRDATPIATSGVIPVLLVLLGTLEILPAQLALWIGIAFVVLRLAITGVVTERLSGRGPSATALWGGIVLAAVSAGVAVAKALLTH